MKIFICSQFRASFNLIAGDRITKLMGLGLPIEIGFPFGSYRVKIKQGLNG
jgi:hypothetical protein